MTWKRVILLAVITAAYTALVLILPFLKDTSFQDIGTYPEWWVVFAVFIVVNCKSIWEAALKCFVFFLISQPLIYLLQVPFSFLGWHIFMYYKRWFIITLLTLPGAAVAFLVKKKNWLSVAILSLANILLTFLAAQYFLWAAARFPYHLLSAVFSLGAAVFFVFTLLDERKHRTAALAVIAAALIASFIILQIMY